MRTVIIDDEKQARETLGAFISKYCPQLEIVGEADGVVSGEAVIKDKKPHVLFLDVQMQDGTGFDLLDKIAEKNFRVIFVTAHDVFAIKAIRYSAFDYLLKPVRPTELIETSEKLTKESQSNLQFQAEILNNFRQHNKKKIALPTTDGIRFLDIAKIVNCEAESCYTHIYTQDNERITVTRTLKEYTELLPESNFFRTHKSHLINLNFVERFVNRDGGYIVMQNKKQIPVAKARRENLLQMLSQI